MAPTPYGFAPWAGEGGRGGYAPLILRLGEGGSNGQGSLLGGDGSGVSSHKGSGVQSLGVSRAHPPPGQHCAGVEGQLPPRGPGSLGGSVSTQELRNGGLGELCCLAHHDPSLLTSRSMEPWLTTSRRRLGGEKGAKARACLGMGMGPGVPVGMGVAVVGAVAVGAGATRLRSTRTT